MEKKSPHPSFKLRSREEKTSQELLAESINTAVRSLNTHIFYGECRYKQKITLCFVFSQTVVVSHVDYERCHSERRHDEESRWVRWREILRLRSASSQNDITHQVRID